MHQEKRRGQEEAQGTLTVHFYDRTSFEGLHNSPRERLSYWIHRILFGDEPWHCNFECDGFVYDCNYYDGCAVYLVYDHQPSHSVEILDSRPDVDWFNQGRRFQMLLSLLDLIGFVPAGRRPVNCVHATARALGVISRCRTPRDLLEVLGRCRLDSSGQDRCR